jgi:hypothetical protein
VSVYTVPLFYGAVTTNGQLMFTSPVSVRTILIDLELANTGATAGSVGAYVQPASGGAATVCRFNNVASNDWHQWQGRVVLDPGAQLFAVVSTGGMQAIATGYQFPL